MSTAPNPQRLRRSTARLAARILAEPATSQAFESLGFHTLADHSDRLRGDRDIAAITLPSGRHSLRRARVKLWRQRGADKPTIAMADGGWKGYEAPLPDVLTRAVRAYPGAFFDVGANTGLYALVAAATRRDVEVHAFEAFPAVADMLEANVALNRCASRIHVNRLAVAETSGRLRLHIPPPIEGTVETSASLDRDFSGRDGTVIEVETTTLDDYWTRVGRPPVAVVKIDTEGTEHRVLAGAGHLVDAARPVVFYEFLPRGAGSVLDEWKAAHRMVDVRLSSVEAVVGDAVRYHDLAWNHAFVPEEKRDSFVRIVEDCGLLVTTVG